MLYENMTAQEVFDTVKAHLLKQGEKAEADTEDGDSTCRYRLECQDSGRQLMCAAGCLLGDRYQGAMEDKSWQTLVSQFGLPKEHSMLITDLQKIHDDSYPHNWESRLTQLAAKHGLVG